MAHARASVYATDMTEDVISDRKILTISTLIGDRYAELGRKLGLTNDQLRVIRARAPDNLQHQVFHTLDLWRKQQGKFATLERLNTALKELGWISVMTQIRNTPDNHYVVV